MKNCFIIMPIETPDAHLVLYQQDKKHFKHVLEHLFIPAIKGVGLEPIPPIAKGSEIIHAEIIKKLETSDLVLCDMSHLNPNVFFELGIRTALNKPVCLVVDDLTQDVPFDTNLINRHSYLSALNAWDLDDEIVALQKHIEESLQSSPKDNTLWTVFGLTMKGKPPKEAEGIEGAVASLEIQIEGLREQFQSFMRAQSVKSPLEDMRDQGKVFSAITSLMEELSKKYLGEGNFSLDIDPKRFFVKIYSTKKPPTILVRALDLIIKDSGISYEISEVPF